jgi:hypothetical protein
MKVLQAYNKRIKAWVKYRKYVSGKTQIVSVKKSLPNKSYKNIKRK